jgi:hypothetical protein
MEAAARHWILKRSKVISSDAKLQKEFTSCFSNIQKGETRALYYRSASNPDAFGFYIKTKNDVVSEEMSKAKTRDELEALCKRLQGITITGIGHGDAAIGAKGKVSSSIGHKDERIEMQDLQHTLELDYFQGFEGS